MIYDLAIIGSGPAGVTAGIYASRQKLKCLMLTKSYGGQISQKAVGIENYPGFEKITGAELIERFKDQIEKQDIEILQEEVVRLKKEDVFFIKTSAKNEYRAKAVIIASGADPRRLEIKGEKEYIGKGLSYCATCDGPLFVNKEVAIIGGGNAGFETAKFLCEFTKKVYILEYADEVAADKKNQEDAEKIENISVITSAQAEEIQGNGFLNKIIYTDRNTKEKKDLKVEGVFVQVGYQPATSFVNGLVEFSERDEIIVDPLDMQTKTEGLFAAGDVNSGRIKQIVVACSQGAIAALSAYKYLRENK